MTVFDAKVPCNGCTACCHHDLIVMHPEMGDRVEEYLTFETVHPLTGEPCLALQHQPGGGSCVYLGEHGCTIHDRAPALCRQFDCRLLYRDIFTYLPRPERRRLLKTLRSKHSLYSVEVMEAGRERLGTLDV